ncbi:hypothetical protein EMIHUDRAFT_416101 [Emiliania huxleyi CCMP1516]|uniref:UBC core domain-containing protein n=4 Tax=Eukaryota TaxID=2759 RepID=A0A0D3IYA8_EMIH1|nr:hypothetical protein EMIHUDRAFT_416101 [Emiliania huxleyi CCMP1516]EOD16243.1 hypothetical protein EMIHUDRAFT_416101 [Emiliania huxleyi CCMP1516]|mmetsp:Transcript_8555/g.28056  ORF Transcript_8555/g.28056 Transcript_8555/m.28056 type:complete len:185 (-) Transcript_8555:329-883(-)|eukprot:XP_005768672.1 hypothetical protein EMIHUDRAFT_416101 [Emiliania huxleyi CCMP1516]
MIKLFSLKEEKAKEAAAGSSTAKVAPGLIRMQKDMSELTLDHGCKLAFPNGKEDLMNFELTIKATDGIYRNGKFVFKVTVPSAYPHDPPKVQCLTTIYHPNIDMEGAVCLNILREDWKPVLTIQSVIMGLQFLILEPNPDDPLNKEAALHMTKNKQQFEQLVRQTFKGRQMRVGDKLYSFPCFE